MQLLYGEIKAHKDFVLASVKGDYGENIRPLLRYAVLIDVPRDIRLQRVKERSFQINGEKVLDLGCGYGFYTDYFMSIGANVI